MADYYPLISRAVSGLSDQSPEMRGAVYERARSALLLQLRSLDPPLSDADIELEREALDDAIARIEAEFTGVAADPEPEPEPAPYAPQPVAESASAASSIEAGREIWAQEPAPGGWNETWSEKRDDYAFPEPDFPSPAATDDNDPEASRASPAPSPAEENAAQSAPQGFTLPGARAAGEQPARRTPVSDRVSDRPRPRVDTVKPRVSSGGGLRAAIVALSLVVVIGAIALVAYWLSNSETSAPAPVAVAEAPAVSEEGKIEERIGGEPAPAAPAAPTAPAAAAPQQSASVAPAVGVTPSDEMAVAQRAILYEEDPANPQGEPRAVPGQATWHLDPPAAGAVDPSVRATVRFESGMVMTMTMRRNLDPTLPASHTIELSFVTGEQTGRAVRDIGLLQLKDEETVRGAPVAGLPVPVKDNFFLIGLSNIPNDIQRNANLLLQRNWIDIPIRFAAGQRAIVSFEKGMSGEQIIARAFQAWNGQATAN